MRARHRSRETKLQCRRTGATTHFQAEGRREAKVYEKYGDTNKRLLITSSLRRGQVDRDSRLRIGSSLHMVSQLGGLPNPISRGLIGVQSCLTMLLDGVMWARTLIPTASRWAKSALVSKLENRRAKGGYTNSKSMGVSSDEHFLHSTAFPYIITNFYLTRPSISWYRSR